MASLPAAYRGVLIAYAVLSVAMWTVPLLSVVHVESSAIVAAAAFFGAGLSTPAFLRSGDRFARILALQEAALLVPWLLLSITALWQPNCDYIRGLLFFAGFPGVTVVFAVSFATLLHRLPIGRAGWWIAGAGILIIVLPTIFDIGFHPQFYSYNHVYGGFLGPIYDEDPAVRPGLFAFRGVTLLWCAFFLALAGSVERPAARRPRVGTLVCAALIAGAYLSSARLGFVTTYDRIEDVLGGTHRTPHFEIYYDPSRTSARELRRLVDEHEYRYAQLRDRLGIDVAGPIRSYVYPSADVKARLTGARHTNVAPVWLSVPQTHALSSSFSDVFPHELVHVFSREFGLPVLRASVSVGLVEGLAVALEPPDGRPGPHEQVSAALLGRHLPPRSTEPAEDLVDVVASHLSPLGFWTGRGAVSYTTMGSFVRYLLEAYGAEPFMRAYPTAAFEASYGKAPEVLAREWTDHVLALEAVGRSTADLVAARFAVPSLFEKDCPHYVPPYQRRLDQARRELARGDTTAAYRAASDAVSLEPGSVPALTLWAALALQAGEAAGVAERLSEVDEERFSAALHVRRGDALALLGRAGEARESYDRARAALPAFAHEAVGKTLLRRALAEDVEALRVLVSAPRPNREPPPDEGAARLAVALARARDGSYEQALDLMRTTSTSSLSTAVPYVGEALVRRRYVWLGRLSYAAERLGDAAAYADSAAAAYAGVGALSEAEALRDVRGKMLWLLETQMERVAAVRHLIP